MKLRHIRVKLPEAIAEYNASPGVKPRVRQDHPDMPSRPPAVGYPAATGAA